MKSKKLRVGVIAMFVGTICIAIALTYDWYTTSRSASLVQAMDLLRSGAEIDHLEQWSAEDLDSVYQLEIPAIELDQYVLAETTEENLALALTQVIEGRNPELDNVTIAGHRGYRGDRHFSKLPDVQKGDELVLSDQTHRYRYLVKSIEVVEPQDVHVLENNGPELTLITCTLSGEQRVVVKGELIDVEGV
ncbi:class D sortase [Amphibacillus marinus]|uniref:class D sortase n=1 Tax=Amphibacillus marinus TaxID=872970 RepID=UPI000B864AE7|nr:class D sortase [Amphibacillus marinus]